MEEDIKIIKNHYVFTTNHVLDDENKRFKQAIENLINKNKELRQEVAEYERREGQQNQNMVSALEEAFKYSLEIKDLEIKNKEQEKIIELMAKDIAENKLDEDICSKVRNPEKEECDCYADMYDACYGCVIEYYEKKASEENGYRTE